MRSLPFETCMRLVGSGLLMILLASSLGAQQASKSSQKEPSEEAQQKMTSTIQSKPPNSVLSFNAKGDLLMTVAPTPADIKTYKSLSAFVSRSKKSPEDSCSNPSPVPPPPCIRCDNGHIVCSNAKFGSSEK